MVRPNPADLGHKVPANAGDPALIIWTMASGEHALATHPTRYFDANSFWPFKSTLAYSDTLVPLVPAYAVVHAATHSWAASINVIVLLLVLLNLCAAFALGRRLTGRDDAALVGAIAFAFSGYVLAQWGHIQLQTLGLLPLGYLLLLKTLDERRFVTAAGLGVVSACVALCAASYGAVFVATVPVVVIGHVALNRKGRSLRTVPVLALAGVVAAVLVLPAAVQHLRLQSTLGFKFPLVPSLSLHPTDLLMPPGSYAWRPLEHSLRFRTGEHRFFPGLITVVLALIGAAVLVWRSRRSAGRREGPPAVRVKELWLLAAAGAVALLLAGGPTVLGQPAPFRYLHDHVPGFGGVRVTARFAVVSLLSAAMLAALGFAWLVHRLGRSRTTQLATIVVAGLMLAELAAPLTWGRLAADRVTLAVYRDLARRPPGAVVELPMIDPRVAPEEWAYVEAPRLVYSTLDWKPRLNGYSGFFPPTYLDDIDRLSAFPAPAALERARARRVRYVVIHVGREAGYDVVPESRAAEMVRALPPSAVPTRVGRTWLVDLGPAEPAEPA